MSIFSFKENYLNATEESPPEMRRKKKIIRTYYFEKKTPASPKAAPKITSDVEAKRNSPIVKEPVESERLPKHAPKVRSLKNIPELNKNSYEYQEEESSCVIENYVEQDSFMPLKDIGNTVVNRDRKKSRDLQTTSRSPLKLTEKTKNQKKTMER